jgi:hypothetical protein
VLDALGIGPAAAYGRHTGASIAVEFGRRHPSLCTMVLTDGYPIWTADERERMLGGYLPALVPSWDGAHLLWSWFRYRDQHVFWPWFDWRAEKRATRDVPPLEFLQRGALEFLLAGDGYRVGYSAAFRHDGGLALDGITVPVCLGTRSSDLIHPMRDRAPPQSWRIEAPTDPLAAAVMERELLHQHPAPVRPFIAPPCLPVPGRASPDFLAVGDSRLLMRRVFGTGETILIIPWTLCPDPPSHSTCRVSASPTSMASSCRRWRIGLTGYSPHSMRREWAGSGSTHIAAAARSPLRWR